MRSEHWQLQLELICVWIGFVWKAGRSLLGQWMSPFIFYSLSHLLLTEESLQKSEIFSKNNKCCHDVRFCRLCNLELVPVFSWCFKIVFSSCHTYPFKNAVWLVDIIYDMRLKVGKKKRHLDCWQTLLKQGCVCLCLLKQQKL